MTKWKTYRTVLMMCVALGWWGIWFPELAVWTEAVCAVEVEEKSSSVQSEDNVVQLETAREVYEGLLHAERDQICIKSRLFEIIERYLQRK